MISIPFPNHSFKIKTIAEKDFIFDEFRKRWIMLTPEEWVRQNVLQYIVSVKKYPASLISVEKQIQVGHVLKRFDAIIYKNELPWMMIECKAPDIRITTATLNQILIYNQTMQVNYLCLTNGSHTVLWEIMQDAITELDAFPTY